jgi:hypothetical protein
MAPGAGSALAELALGARGAVEGRLIVDREVRLPPLAALQPRPPALDADDWLRLVAHRASSTNVAMIAWAAAAEILKLRRRLDDE